jgi:hypothetical protein
LEAKTTEGLTGRLAGDWLTLKGKVKLGEWGVIDLAGNWRRVAVIKLDDKVFRQHFANRPFTDEDKKWARDVAKSFLVALHTGKLARARPLLAGTLIPPAAQAAFSESSRYPNLSHFDGILDPYTEADEEAGVAYSRETMNYTARKTGRKIPVYASLRSFKEWKIEAESLSPAQGEMTFAGKLTGGTVAYMPNGEFPGYTQVVSQDREGEFSLRVGRDPQSGNLSVVNFVWSIARPK